MQHATPALVYLVPSFHNPTGSLMPEGARREVAALAEATGVAVVEDESLAELTFGDGAAASASRHSRRGRPSSRSAR